MIRKYLVCHQILSVRMSFLFCLSPISNVMLIYLIKLFLSFLPSCIEYFYHTMNLGFKKERGASRKSSHMSYAKGEGEKKKLRILIHHPKKRKDQKFHCNELCRFKGYVYDKMPLLFTCINTLLKPNKLLPKPPLSLQMSLSLW